MNYKDEYKRWIEQINDGELLNELKNMDDVQIEDAFYRDLAFGTGGLRGTIGAGTNRMNVYVVAKASQGLADYIVENQGKSVVIGYDSRIKSDVFAKTAGCVFAANGIEVNMWPQLLPVPTVSYAVRALKAFAGVMITASHNPSKYNGYKVYGSDGCQITTEAATTILKKINALDIFSDVKRMDFDEAVSCGKIKFIDMKLLDTFLEEVKNQSVLYGDEIDRDVAIVYSPLNGTGLIPITRALKESGFTNITVVEEQRNPDGNFPTCPYPNPEVREAMELGLEYCRKTGADLLLATDPDADRCGIAVKDGDEYKLLSGNEVGLLLLDYICSQRVKHNKMPEQPVFIKTIVTMDLAEKIAKNYGVETINVLTGFKFIGEQIGRLEAQGRAADYICGFEESYGYLTGSYVRDKDAVNAAYMICEMFAYYKTRGISLLDKLAEIYDKYGYCLNTLHSFEFPGSSGMQKMDEIMQNFRKGLDEIAGMKVTRTEDYLEGLNGLPKSDVIKYFYKGEEVQGSVVIRPSGTEPKLKAYISVTGGKDYLEKNEKHINTIINQIIKKDMDIEKNKYTYTEYYVAFLDILGFKNIIEKKSCQEIYDIFNRIDKNHLTCPIRFEDDSLNMPHEEVHRIVMSDSIIFYVKASVVNGLNALVTECRFLADVLSRRDFPILLRGAVAKGDFFCENNHFYGNALNTAYNMEEKAARYPRIIMFKSITEGANYNEDYLKTEVYEDEDSFLCIDYLKMKNTRLLNRLKEYCIDRLNKEIDLSIRDKYLYLLKRINNKLNNE